MSSMLNEINQPVVGGQESTVDDILDRLDFALPVELEASEPPEARGLTRESVRLMVSHCGGTVIEHTHFSEIGTFLRAGDLLVINTSGTINAALDASREDGTLLELHLSTHLPGDIWSVELRQPSEHGTRPFHVASAGERLRLPAGGEALLFAPYATDRS